MEGSASIDKAVPASLLIDLDSCTDVWKACICAIWSPSGLTNSFHVIILESSCSHAAICNLDSMLYAKRSLGCVGAEGLAGLKPGGTEGVETTAD